MVSISSTSGEVVKKVTVAKPSKGQGVSISSTSGEVVKFTVTVSGVEIIYTVSISSTSGEVVKPICNNADENRPTVSISSTSGEVVKEECNRGFLGLCRFPLVRLQVKSSSNQDDLDAIFCKTVSISSTSGEVVKLSNIFTLLLKNKNVSISSTSGEVVKFMVFILPAVILMFPLVRLQVKSSSR